MSSKRVKIENLKEFSIKAMVICGMREDDACTSAQVLVTNDSWGIFTHGTKQLLSLLTKNILIGRLNAKAYPLVEVEGPSWAIVNGNCAMPMVTSTVTMNMAMAKARESGIGYAGVRNSSHFGAAGYYANMAVEEDMIGISMSNCEPCMTAPGAKESVIGTNSFAYAVPAGKEKPIFLDIAMSNVAMGKVLTAKFKGEKKIPGNWVVDGEGIPTDDLSRIPDYPLIGSLLPMAGHKGYGFALMVEVLSAVLTGAAFTKDVTAWWKTDSREPVNQGHAFIAINIGAIMPVEQFKERMDKMIRQLKEAPKGKGADDIYLPGEKEWINYEESIKIGIPLPRDVIANLETLAKQLKMDINSLFE